MNKQQAIKWLTGISGALLFTGFVGYIGNQNEAAAGTNTTASSGTVQSQNREEIFNDSSNQPRWDFDSGTSSDSGNGVTPPGSDGSSFPDNFTAPDSSSSGSQSQGRMRTRAS